MIAAPLRHKHFLWALGLVAAAYVAVLAYVVAIRVRFPYDLYIWSESPFLTNMLKLHNGVELYGPPADANSFVYTPGLEYLCYALLSPFGLHLDVTACRMVTLTFAVAAAAAAGVVQASLVDDMTTPRRERGLVLLTTALSGLLVFKNFTVDVCHPDNLHLFLVAGAMLLGLRVLRTHSFRLACATAAILGLGILLKQTAAFTGVGVALYLALFGHRRWGLARSAVVVLAALATTGAAAYWLLVALPHGRFWLLEVLTRHDAALSKIDALAIIDGAVFYRMPLYLVAPLCAVRGLVSRDERLRRTTGLWLFLGLFGAAPGIAAYVKTYGLWNNLIVIDLWGALLVVPTLIAVSHERLEHRPERGLGVVAMAVFVVWTLALYPIKRRPTAEHLRYGRQLEAALRDDLQARRKILVAHGSAALIRAGYRDVPLDRSNTLFELVAAHLDQLAHTDQRLAARAYDKIYLAWPSYGARIDPVLNSHYQMASSIAQAPLPEQTIINGLSLEMVVQVNVYEPRANP